MLDKRPRAYAFEIVNLTTIKKRRDALAQVPEKIRGIVETHVRNTYAITKLKKQSGR